MDNDNVKITNAEWIIMEALWEKSPQSLSDIIESIKEKVGWSYKTYDAFMRRLLNKKAVDFKMEHGIRQYSPLVSKQELVNHETKSFVDRIYNGSTENLMAHFLNQKQITKEEKKRLLNLLEQDIKEGD
jgi:BlaI family penicillinase repressor